MLALGCAAAVLTAPLFAAPAPPVPDALITFLPTVSDPEARAAIAAAGLATVEQLRPLPVYRAVGVSTEATRQGMIALRGEPIVRWAEIDGQQTIQQVPNDPYFTALQWDMRQIGMPAAWDLRPSAPSVTVAVLDTGVDLTHPDLQANVLANDGYNFLNDTTDVQDDQGHGTAVAGIIGAVGNNGEGIAGEAWRTRILPVKVLDSSGRGPDSAMVKGIIYAADHGANVINISSTGTGFSAALQDAVAYAQQQGALVVAAAGNTGNQGNAPVYPAALDGVLAVAASDQQNALASFSQHGSFVALAAPGVNVPSTTWAGAGRGLYAAQSGTSIAAPHVSGAAALIWALRPDLSATAVADAITSTVHPGASDDPGTGVLDVAAALTSVRLGVRPAQPDKVVSEPAPAPASARPPTPPPPTRSRTWYFAEGSTSQPFDTWFALQNGGAQPATATFSFVTGSGQPTTTQVQVPPHGRATLHANDVIPNASFGTIVHADGPVYVERSMYFGHDGLTTAGTAAPARAWYLAEGSTAPPYGTWILLLNPGNVPASATVTFLREDGTRVQQPMLVPPLGRASLYANEVVPSSAFSTEIVSDQPIVAERSMYVNSGQGGDGAVAISRPAKVWYGAAGVNRDGLSTWVLAENPGSVPANTTVTLFTSSGSVIRQPLLVPPHTRASLPTALVAPGVTFGYRVDADQPIVVESSVFNQDGTAGMTPGAVPAASREWFYPEGSTAGSFEEQLMVFNPQSSAANVELDLERPGGQASSSQIFNVPANGDLTLDVNADAPDSDVSLHLISDQPVVADRLSYFALPSGTGMTSSSGIPRP